MTILGYIIYAFGILLIFGLTYLVIQQIKRQKPKRFLQTPLNTPNHPSQHNLPPELNNLEADHWLDLEHAEQINNQTNKPAELEPEKKPEPSINLADNKTYSPSTSSNSDNNTNWSQRFKNPFNLNIKNKPKSNYIAYYLMAPPTHSYPLISLKRILNQCGLDNNESIFIANNSADYIFEVVNAHEPGKFDFKTYSNNDIKGIVFILNPKKYSGNSFSKMLSVMHEVQTKLGGELLDEHKAPISDTHLNKVYDAL
jgi:FtsZ-interacting cell division protein ZipA